MSAEYLGRGICTLKPTAAVCMLLVLVGCKDGELNLPFIDQDTEAETLATGTAASTTEEDVEAPDVFSVTEEGLWDGRPSLGGVWVAHPDVAEPERVIIRNETTGESVIGALFRRERDTPGPALQVSSDAAEALGMLAGSPQLLNVVALRRQAVPATPPIAEPDPEFIAAETVAPEAPSVVTETPLDGVEVPAAVDPIVPAAPTPTGEPLDAMADPLVSAAAAIDAAEAEQEATFLAAPAPAQTIAETPVSSISRPYIQIGIFGVEGNANEVAQRMSSQGLSTRVLAQQSQGRDFWRVLVGPASSEAARTTALQEVRDLGFTDAYIVAN